MTEKISKTNKRRKIKLENILAKNNPQKTMEQTNSKDEVTFEI